MGTTGHNWLTELERLSNGLAIISVEGVNDVRVYRRFLNKLNMRWDTQAGLQAVHGKPHLLVRQNNDPIGLAYRTLRAASTTCNGVRPV